MANEWPFLKKEKHVFSQKKSLQVVILSIGFTVSQISGLNIKPHFSVIPTLKYLACFHFLFAM